jgi:hypothetical protein
VIIGFSPLVNDTSREALRRAVADARVQGRVLQEVEAFGASLSNTAIDLGFAIERALSHAYDHDWLTQPQTAQILANAQDWARMFIPSSGHDVLGEQVGELQKMLNGLAAMWARPD